jgi:hypothetical protein
MSKLMNKHVARMIALVLLAWELSVHVHAQDSRAPTIDGSAHRQKTGETGSPADVLTPAEWREVEAAVNRALEWLARQQQADGSFPTVAKGQPGVTSLCMMAFMAHGHLPGEPKYGQQIERQRITS